MCDVWCDCVDRGECAFCCGGVVCVGACDVLFEWFGNCGGVACPQGSELLGDDSVVSVASGCVSAGCCGDVGMGLNTEVGLFAKFGRMGAGFECMGYIPCRHSCHSIKSASPVICSIIAVVSYSSGNA